MIKMSSCTPFLFAPCRDPSLPHSERQDHLQQPERLWGGGPCRQRSRGGGGRTEGHPEDRHPISGQRLLQRLQLQLHQWDGVFSCYRLLLQPMIAPLTFPAEPGSNFTSQTVSCCVIEPCVVFITDAGCRVVLFCIACEIMSYFHHPITWSEPQQARLNLQPCGGEM